VERLNDGVIHTMLSIKVRPFAEVNGLLEFRKGACYIGPPDASSVKGSNKGEGVWSLWP